MDYSENTRSIEILIFCLFAAAVNEITHLKKFSENIPDIRTIFWKTVLYVYTGYKNIFPTPKGVLISDIHCTTNI